MSIPTDAPGAAMRVTAGVTPDETVRSAASTVQKFTFKEQVDHLLITVGPRITAAGAGLRDGRQLPAWRRGDEPREVVRRERVASMAEVTVAITAEYSAAVAASFLRSSQPALDDRSPLMMIREATLDSLPEVMGQVRGAVRAFLKG